MPWVKRCHPSLKSHEAISGKSRGFCFDGVPSCVLFGLARLYTTGGIQRG
jgi:hypothetical protein